jgi:predicted metalloprotease with PDZ domain
MSVEVMFREVPQGVLEVRMSRSSPGRYALHEFAKNVYGVSAFDGAGKPLAVASTDLHGWEVSGHDGTVRIAYTIFGNRVDGTYLGIDASHAHINAPAALVWARGLELRGARVTLVPPAGRDWKAATQLFPTSEPLTFSAPNLAYLMDSPIEFSDFDLATFTLPSATGDPGVTFRVAVHHTDSQRDVDAFAEDLEKIARAASAVFGELPPFDTGTYTFIADYLPTASRDGMEHRNSTILTSTGSLGHADERRSLISTAAHELFHVWNVERIRPASLEPFDFEKANVSGELWLAEGVTSYYDTLLVHRAGLGTLADTAASFGGFAEAVMLSPALRFRSAVEMSRLAPFVDSAAWIDPTNWPNTYLSYYTFGAALGLALDLSLRDRTDGRVSLDDFMRAMWRTYGKPGGGVPGLVSRPYMLSDARRVLGEVAGEAAFANDFFDRYVEGHGVADYRRLLARAGLVLRPRNPGQPWIGSVGIDFSGAGARIAGPTGAGTPLYVAGLEAGDVLTTLDGRNVTSSDALEDVLSRRKPGDRIGATFLRFGRPGQTTIVLTEDPHMELVPIERTGKPLSERARAFRRSWLGSD